MKAVDNLPEINKFRVRKEWGRQIDEGWLDKMDKNPNQFFELAVFPLSERQRAYGSAMNYKRKWGDKYTWRVRQCSEKEVALYGKANS